MHNVLAVITEGGESAHHGMELPFAPIWFGVIALAVLMALLFILWQFRHAVPMDPRDEEFAAHHIRHGRRRSRAGRR
ncbi:hypothetical protein [Kytococcus schroeteri]|uniref:hypothetical protein n=1 Tax=Kytococcus schroeteri TaxID=138300 RepID=UPI001141C8F9|nr:hypothetical protein [Kytococcus schroeteri]